VRPRATILEKEIDGRERPREYPRNPKSLPESERHRYHKGVGGGGAEQIKNVVYQPRPTGGEVPPHLSLVLPHVTLNLYPTPGEKPAAPPAAPPPHGPVVALNWPSPYPI
jgi:hypothetical protein